MARRRKKRRRYYYTGARGRKREDFEPLGLNLSEGTKRGIAIIVFLLATAISLFGILDLAGGFGDLVTKLLFLVFGNVAYVTPAVFLAVSLSLFLGGRLSPRFDNKESEPEKQSSMFRSYLGMGLFVLSITGLLHLFAIRDGNATAFELVKLGHGGGYMGIFTSFPLYSLMGFGASMIVMVAMLLISILIAFNLSLHGVFGAITGLFKFRSVTSGKTEPEKLKDNIKINTMENSGFSAKSIAGKISPLATTQESEIYSTEVKDENLIDGNEAMGEKFDESDTDLGETPDGYKKGTWALPAYDLLEDTKSGVDSGDVESTVKVIKKTLEDFGVNVEMGEVNVGPTVTQYTFRPAVGVKLSRITGLHSNMALALAAPSLRIEAPIPGQSLVGIEVPNKSSTLVRLKELLQSDVFTKHSSSLAFALGRDVAGHPIVANLAKMPHLLIAGATGTGKSVCINTTICSFLFKNSPEELRIIMIDPKRVELTLYNGIPHLLTPVVTDHKQAVNALKWMVREMDNRYKKLQNARKRNIDEYNQNGNERMPYIVLVVDELADLMTVAKNDVEASIVRLAQMARAVGLHLVLATQYPKAEIITGLIKANINSKIAFAVNSQVNSRVILDSPGAETLLGNGDMLYTAANLPKPKRIQAPFISEKEVSRLVGFIKDQSGPVDYQEEILEKPKSGFSQSGVDGGDDDADDEMIGLAIEEITRARKASATLLQRRLKVGYSRAARILDILEERGMIGPAQGAKPREIYIEE
ncbi:MAG: cell division protein FtsK [Candidatus Doudnabacteria bacterium CG10_big_fil_rev_8_21_14_0_10_41_10]|uniref:Cell division protein FtsK n=1 Tax=Candidatus Doudnabacteria bacterium CG10_big_fil_rev_8_21_14_0_10_41_10 TaxID=1974551 RepID=A0A2H0VEP4_9BACT|nr:MAG: cell division protein FtsK [Candidatus Doudnabacteria bacterium CG10_big_fil_rev_8_21_14_0_10_41_10]